MTEIQEIKATPSLRNALQLLMYQMNKYAGEHRNKASRFRAELLQFEDSGLTNKELTDKISDTIQKAETNEKFVRLAVEALNFNDGVGQGIIDTVQFCKIVYPDGVTARNKQTQIGCHFEEVGEFLNALSAMDTDAQQVLSNAIHAMKALEVLCKDGEPNRIVIETENRIEALDAIADQIVTGSVTGAMHRMDVVRGLHEVNMSNYSRLTDGEMAKDPATSKWLKGPNYYKPNLTKFV